MNTYSIAIYPPLEIGELVKSFKDILFSKIGWYNSRNSYAHISIIEFKAVDKEISLVDAYLTKLTQDIKSFTIESDRIESYPSGTVLFELSTNSKKKTKNFMKQLWSKFPISYQHKSHNPHVSIGRNLNPDQVDLAKGLALRSKINFLCDNVVLRVFNGRQFEVLKSYYFKGHDPLKVEQLDLFS